MRRWHSFIWLVCAAASYIMLMPYPIFGQGFEFPTDDDGWVIVRQTGYLLSIWGIADIDVAPAWETLITFEGPECAHLELVDEWDCANPERNERFSLAYEKRLQIHFDPECKGELCIFAKGIPEAGSICFNNSEDQICVITEIQDECGTPIRRRSVQFPNDVDMDENILFYSELRSGDESVVFPELIYGSVDACGERFPSILLSKIEEEPGIAKYSSFVCKLRNFTISCSAGWMTFRVAYGRVGKYTIKMREVEFTVDKDEFIFSGDIPIYNQYGDAAVCYPYGAHLTFGTTVKVGLDGWPNNCQYFSGDIYGYRGGVATIMTGGLIAQDQFVTFPAEDDYFIYGWSFREATLRYNWKISVGDGPERDARPTQTNMKVFHGFIAGPIYFYDLPDDDTIYVGDIVNMVAVPYPNLKEQLRIVYDWTKEPGNPAGDGTFTYNGSEFKGNSFRADVPGDVLLRYITRDLVSGIWDDSPEPHKVLHIKPKITIVSPAPGSKFDYNVATPGVLTLDATATVMPPSLANDIEWSIWTINGSNLTTIPSPPLGSSITFNYTDLPSENDEFGKKYVIASIPAYDEWDSVFVEAYYTRGGTNHQGGTALTPNWYHYWSDALNVDSEHSYNGRLLTSQTTVFSEFSWIIQIGRNAEWPPPGNPPTYNDYIDGFWATNLHEFWHRDHRVHNFAVHGAWAPPFRDDRDGDGICDTDPNPGKPGQYVGGWEALIGTDPDVPESTEEGGNWAESQGTYGNDDFDWAHLGSQWR